MKRKAILIIAAVLLALILIFRFVPPVKSYFVMSIYSSIENSKSVMRENDFKIKVPSSSGWYPFVITFNPVNFGRWSGTGAQMSIMYNFANFSLSTMSSDIFNPQSPKHSSFYGAYALHQDEGYFGFYDDSADMDEIIMAFSYDYKFLVLDDLGCENPVFEVVSSQVKENVNYLDTEGWKQIDAVINSNAMPHNYTENHTSYIQYGKPYFNAEQDFAVITMYGRMYVKAFEDYNSTIIIYVMSPDKGTIEKCDKDILQNILISGVN